MAYRTSLLPALLLSVLASTSATAAPPSVTQTQAAPHDRATTWIIKSPTAAPCTLDRDNGIFCDGFDGYEFPTIDTTGPRQPPTDEVLPGGLSSTEDGQIISRITVNGRLRIRHDNVTVRDVRINGTGTYMLNVVRKADGTCPSNVWVEYTEIDGSNAAENDIPIYSPCGFTFDHGYVHDVGRTSRLVNDTTISNSFVFSNRTGNSGAHRGAVGTNGGSNNQIINNVLMCEGTGCSAAIPMYGDFAPVDGLLVKHNLLATTGSYCAYGGSLASKPYPEGTDIRFIDNHFSTRYFDTCGRYGPISGFANNVRGNQWTGNVWHESGEPLEL